MTALTVEKVGFDVDQGRGLSKFEWAALAGCTVLALADSVFVPVGHKIVLNAVEGNLKDFEKAAQTLSTNLQSLEFSDVPQRLSEKPQTLILVDGQVVGTMPVLTGEGRITTPIQIEAQFKQIERKVVFAINNSPKSTPTVVLETREGLNVTTNDIGQSGVARFFQKISSGVSKMKEIYRNAIFVGQDYTPMANQELPAAPARSNTVVAYASMPQAIQSRL